MKQFKLADIWISITLFMALLICCMVMRDLGTLIVSYLVIGSWQVISMIVHAYNGWFTQKRSMRRIYHWIAVLSLATLPVGLYALLTFVSPLMAAYYIWLCYDGVYIKMKRPISVLK